METKLPRIRFSAFSALVSICLWFCTAAGYAQVINFDVPGGASGFTNYSGQGAYPDPGHNVWNAVVANGTTAAGLNSDGSSSAITLTCSSDSFYTAGGQGTQGTPSGLQSPFFDSKPGPKACTLNHVPNGTYNLYLYGINGDSTTDCNRGTTFTVNGASLSTVNTNAAYNSFILGSDYVLFSGVSVNGGSLSFTYQANTAVSGNTIGNFNGLQLVPVKVINFDVPGGASGFTNYSGQGAYPDPGHNVWNAIVANGTTSAGLYSDGTSSSITLTSSSDTFYTAGGQGTQGTPSGLQSPFFDSKPGPKTCTLNNVPNGTYSLYFYGINGDSATDCNRGTTFTIGGVAQSTVNTNAAYNSFIEGNDYVVFPNVAVTSGSLSFTYQANTSVSGNTIGNFNGLQLVAGAVGSNDFNPVSMMYSSTYPTSYSDWMDAFVAGNGQMGIMVLGNPLNETIIYNDRGFNLAASTAHPVPSFNQVTASQLSTIASDCIAGNYSAADTLAANDPGWSGGGQGARHPGFEMLLTISQSGTPTNYSRTCNFETGEIAVNWTDNRGTWVRKSFVSRADNVTVQYLTQPTNGTITCSLQLTTDPGMSFPSGMTFTPVVSSTFLDLRVNYLSSAGTAGYEGVVRVVPTGGTVGVSGNVLTITNANSVLLLSKTAEYLTNASTQWNQQLLQSQLSAVSTNYTTLLNDQIASHGAIYNRVQIDLNASASDRLLTNEQLLTMQANSSTPVLALWERLFDAGRYLYLSASSAQTPPDLYGLWVGSCNASTDSAYNMDANLNLQVSSGNIGNMPEAMAGYFSIVQGWASDFTTNASKLLNCRGMLSCGNTPGTRGVMGQIDTMYPYQYATGEMPWILYPFWEHYLVTGDTSFLQNTLYPLLQPMGLFYQDFLTQFDSNGHYIFAGSVSPEHRPPNTGVSLVNNSTFDVAGAKWLLSTLIQASNVLGVQQGAGQGVQTWTSILNKLPPYLVNTDGALQEWDWPGFNTESVCCGLVAADWYNHRHSSQLVPVWPYQEITPEGNASWYNAAKTLLSLKDQYPYENTGHGLCHAALIAAGLKNATSVSNHLLTLTGQGYYYNGLTSSHLNAHGGFYCSDTCNTVPTIMMEMLVASTPTELELLPAIPSGLNQGAIAGVLGRNQITIQEMDWNLAAKTVNCTVQSAINQSITLIERQGIAAISTTATVSSSPLGNIARVVQLQAGVPTTISLTLD